MPPFGMIRTCDLSTKRAAVKLMQDNGARILAGSDLGGDWVVPGFSLHQEFGELRAAGLSPLQVLQAATLSGAQFAGRDATMGSVEVGKLADLVLLDANPLEDSKNLDRIAAVFMRGKHFSRSALDKMLEQVAADYAAQPHPNMRAAADAECAVGDAGWLGLGGSEQCREIFVRLVWARHEIPGYARQLSHWREVGKRIVRLPRIDLWQDADDGFRREVHRS